MHYRFNFCFWLLLQTRLHSILVRACGANLVEREEGGGSTIMKRRYMDCTVLVSTLVFLQHSPKKDIELGER